MARLLLRRLVGPLTMWDEPDGGIRWEAGVTPLVRFEGLPGEFSQHDFGEVWVTYQDGTETKVHFFASRLKYSRWVEVTLVPDERVETLVRAPVDHLAAFGGIPLASI